MFLRTIRCGVKPFLALGIALGSLLPQRVQAQPPAIPVLRETRQPQRDRLHRSLLQGINRGLSLPLADSTEEVWRDALYNLELLQYRSPWAEQRLHSVAADMPYRSVDLQRAYAEALYALYPRGFEPEQRGLFRAATDARLMAIAGEYLLRAGDTRVQQELKDTLSRRLQQDSGSAVLQAFQQRLAGTEKVAPRPSLPALFAHPFADSAVVLFSLQRPNRDYPGVVILRNRSGQFVNTPSGQLLAIPQLARSISNLPGYLSNGNTPQGLFRLEGFGISRSSFIGPTPNLQLCLPVECSIAHFLRDSSRTDTLWHEALYRQLLPDAWQDYPPFYEAWYAGAVGRTEIIAHGTAVDPAWYRQLPCYPMTPTLGCLCTTELWDPETGLRQFSDQQLLADAVKEAGGASGYLVVVELEDERRPVEWKDVLPYLPKP